MRQKTPSFLTAFLSSIIIVALTALLLPTIVAPDAHSASNDDLSAAPTIQIRVASRRTARLARNQPTVDRAPIAPTPPEKQIPAFLDQTDVKEREKRIVSELITLLPQKCSSTLQKFYVRYEKPERRGMANADTMILDGTVPDNEFRALFLHEFGHVADLGCLTGAQHSQKSGFRDGNEVIFEDDPSVRFYRISWENERTKHPDARADDFVSGYGASDPFEDMAESFVYFILHNEAFRKRAEKNRALAAKYEWFQTNLFAEIPTASRSRNVWNGRLPWDITKLAYTWTPNTKTHTALAANDDQ